MNCQKKNPKRGILDSNSDFKSLGYEKFSSKRTKLIQVHNDLLYFHS